MRWSPQQDAALVAISKWLEEPDQQVFKLFGYAGTGKTTMAREIAEGVEGQVRFGAFTGKAANVLRQKGCLEASTIHSMIYHTKEQGRATLKRLEAELAEVFMELRTVLENDTPEDRQRAIDEDSTVQELRRKINNEREALSRPTFVLNPDSEVAKSKLVIIDECSMVDQSLGMDLLSYGTKILVLGDPAQLPPVHGEGFFTSGGEPDIVLTDIHRQAADNPIIAMATRVRQEGSLSLGSYGESRVIEKCHVDQGDAMRADQMLVGRNATRHASNRKARSLKGFEELLPEPDDKLVCLRNTHDKGLLNGAIWYTDGIARLDRALERLTISIRPEDEGVGEPQVVEAHSHYFLNPEKTLPWWERKEAEEFDYGYALTTHKAQGSQWNDVMVFDESWCFRSDRHRWLYTAITRAAERVTVVRM